MGICGASALSCSTMYIGEVIGQLCHYRGSQVYAELQDVLVSGIRTNMERETDTASESSDQQAESPVDGEGRVCNSLN